MKTEALIDLLARGEAPVDPYVPVRRFAAALGLGGAGAFILLFVSLGVNPALTDELSLPGFWIKMTFTGSLTAAALMVAARLARPGVPVGRGWFWVAFPVLVIWVLMAIALAPAEPGTRLALLLGATWRTCPLNILMLSAPTFVASVWALRGLAPTNLRLAGAAAGLCSGALGAVIYGLHCPELATPFIGVWYVIGIALPTALGAWLGPRLLRW